MASNIRNIVSDNIMYIPFSYDQSWNRDLREQTKSVSKSVDISSYLGSGSYMDGHNIIFPSKKANNSHIANAKITGNLYFATGIITYVSSSAFTPGLGRAYSINFNEMIPVVLGTNVIYTPHQESGAEYSTTVYQNYNSYISSVNPTSAISKRAFRIESFNASISSGTLSASMNVTQFSYANTSTTNGVVTVFIEIEC